MELGEAMDNNLVSELSKKNGIAQKTIFVIIAILIIFTTYKIDDWIYPVKYETEVNKYSEIYGVDKELIESVIR